MGGELESLALMVRGKTREQRIAGLLELDQTRELGPKMKYLFPRNVALSQFPPTHVNGRYGVPTTVLIGGLRSLPTFFVVNVLFGTI
jgi:hypothetical protein